MNIEAWRDLPGRPAQFAPLPEEVHPALAAALRESGITALYTHQATAWRHASAGEHVVLVTGTASGKTLGYNLPVLDRLLRDPNARALYLFPTKALAQDQASNLKKLIEAIKERGVGEKGRRGQPESVSPTPERRSLSPFPYSPIPLSVYDGDTPSSSRPAIRARARLVISNPDMLHAGILPHHTGWAELFRNLAFVVIDEMHVYRGVFGSHVANVLRRLKRIAGFYGTNPQFILTSATIGNPAELAQNLIEARTALVDEDGAARGPKHFLFYNPPVVNRDLGLRRSALHESVRLAEDLLAYGIQTILFARSRRSVELVLTYLRQRSDEEDRGVATSDQRPGGAPRELRSRDRQSLIANPLFPYSPQEEPLNRQPSEPIRGYRSGYLPQQRREIERGLRQGSVRAVVATNALELGIDIGGMGAALLAGYPGTIAASWQQAGRAGRGESASLAVLVATADPLDQFLARHPDYFFDRSPEQALLNPNNLLILLEHLRCAAFELPFRRGDRFGQVEPGRVLEFLEFLQEEGVLHASGERYFWMADRYPAEGVSLRSASADNVVLQTWEGDPDGERLETIGDVDRASATWMVHPQAVYLHEGQTYIVEELNLEQGLARLRRAGVDYYTEHRSETTVQLLEQLSAGESHGATRAYGEIQVTTQVTGYRKVKWYTHEQLGLGELDLPPGELQTTGYWLALSDATVDRLREEGLWRNDPNDYGPGWPRQRDLARARDGYRCQVCSAPEQGRSHDVHHKVPFRSFVIAAGGNPPFEVANRLENLVTLCPACHRRAETAVRVRSGLAGLAFVLGHLAPFFLMCDGRDLGVHADPQSPLAEGRPSVVLYDQVPAGIGFSQRLFELHDELARRAYELVSACECQDGCPSCVGPGGENGLGGKRETLAILETLVE
jgi:DEAD/DEAH box helicase domain-containing protein